MDVAVYRLNIAPNIFWARKLIQDGAIFVSSTKKSNIFEKMYAPLKKEIYPLKLRDPKHLYKKTKWSLFGYSATNKFKRSSAKLNFLLEPLRNINYTLQPGEVILCAPGAVLNLFKTNNLLWKKPVPKHFLTISNITETKKKFKQRSNQIKSFANMNTNFTNIAILLFNPTYNDLDKKDRVKRSFVRWISL